MTYDATQEEEREREGEVIVAHIREAGEGGSVVVRRFLKGKLLGKVGGCCSCGNDGGGDCPVKKPWVD